MSLTNFTRNPVVGTPSSAATATCSDKIACSVNRALVKLTENSAQVPLISFV